jgi:hypothetical protein
VDVIRGYERGTWAAMAGPKACCLPMELLTGEER